MKFAQQLNEDLVPEWKVQYLDYKVGKKKLKKIISQSQDVESLRSKKTAASGRRLSTTLNPDVEEASIQSEAHSVTFREPLRNPRSDTDVTPLLEQDHIAYTEDNHDSDIHPHPSMIRQSIVQNISEGTPLKRVLTSVSRATTTATEDPFPRLRERAKSFAMNFGRRNSMDGFELQYEREKRLFVEWLDTEFAKIDRFYKEKETDFLERFLVLQDQLYQLREHKIHLRHVPADAHFGIDHNLAENITDLGQKTRDIFEVVNRFELPTLPRLRFLRKTEVEIEEIGVPVELLNGSNESLSEDRGDYVVKKSKVPYLTARRMLKTAMLEYHRGLELLKSYRTVNRTAFRKMVKKFDKTTGSKILPVYMEKINASYFSTSEILDNLFTRVGDLYAIYFENGNRKQAVEMLRSKEKEEYHYMSLFLSGIFIGVSIPLLVLGIIRGLEVTLAHSYPEGRFMFQIWGGFLLATLMALLLGVNLIVWAHFKVNYKFIFEFNPNDNLNFHQYFLLPSLSLVMIALFGWFCFSDFWPARFPGRHWPWMYIGIFLGIFFWPFNQLYRSSRRWLQVALWRLLFSGFYPVEFRDFFLGDIFCSLTYTMGNISFFICLYATDWRGVIDGTNTSNCGSSKSRAMGFLSTLPSIWRFLQCWRRYCDSGDWFPHLANMLKYTISAMYYMCLSIYRIDNTTSHRAIFIVFAIINSIYSAAWDIFMDWSLMQANSKNRLLRNDLAFKNPLFYYAAIVVNVILRFQWIFYALFSKQIEQSMVTSFCIALAEIFRRFIWVFFRMENEHCTNVRVFRASRDSPLPYPMTRMKKITQAEADLGAPSLLPQHSRVPRMADEEVIEVHHEPKKTHSIFSKFSEVLGHAHMKDFQRRKVKPSDAKGSESDEDNSDTEAIDV